MALQMITMALQIITSAIAFIKKLDAQQGLPVRGGEALTKREVATGIVISSIGLFFSWGLAYGLLDVMNYHVKVAMAISRGKAAGLAAAYYGAYIPGTLWIGGPLVRICGYRFAMTTGLFILAVGMLLMSAGASSCSFGGMVGAHFVIGVGVSTLERSANPYATNCGPAKSAAFRILFSQSWAGIGTVVAPPLASAFIFSLDTSTRSPAPDPLKPGRCLMPGLESSGCEKLGTVVTFYRWLALGVFIFDILLALLFFRTTWFPEVAVPTPVHRESHGLKLWKHLRFWKNPLIRRPKKFARVWSGFLANFVNLGCQVTFAQFFLEHMKVDACQSDHAAAMWMSVAQALFVAGRICAAVAVIYPRVCRPRLVLLVYLVGAIVTTGLGTKLVGTAAIVVACFVMFSEAPSFPLTFETATAGFEEWKPDCETVMILSICGGAVQPALMGILVEKTNIATGWWLTMGCFCLVAINPVALNVWPPFRRAVDAAETGETGHGSVEEATGIDIENAPDEARKGFRQRMLQMMPLRRKDTQIRDTKTSVATAPTPDEDSR